MSKQKKKKIKDFIDIFLMNIDEGGFNEETVVPGAFQTADLKPIYYKIMENLYKVHGRTLIITMKGNKNINLYLRHYKKS